MREQLFVGAGKAEIKIAEDLFPIESFIGAHSKLFARVLYIQETTTQVIVSLELTSVRDYEIKKLQKLVSDQLHVLEQDVWICVTHTFSAPHTRSKEALEASNDRLHKNIQLCNAIEDAVEEACIQANEHTEQCSICFHKGFSDVNVNRDIETCDGWWIGSNELEYSNKEIPIVSFVNEKGKFVAIWYSYDVQSSIMDGFAYIDSDLCGMASTYIEKQFPNIIAMYCVGAAGDQAPKLQMKQKEVNSEGKIEEITYNDRALAFVEALGIKLGSAVTKALSKQHRCRHVEMKKDAVTITCDGQRMPLQRQDLYPTRCYSFEKDEQRRVTIKFLYIGPIAVVALQPEIGSLTAHRIQAASPYKLTMILTMVNGGDKYMANQISYERMTYEAMNSKYARGSEDRLVKTCNHMIHKHWRK